MEIFYLLMAIAAAVWSVTIVRFHDSVTGIAVFIVATCMFPPEFGVIQLGVTNLSFDRVWLGVLLVQFVFDIKTGKAKLRSLTASDIFFLLFLSWLTFRTFTTPIGHEVKGQPSTLAHWINGYMVPAVLYFVARCTDTRKIQILPAAILLSVFGVYLSVTALFEVTHQWSWVFPSFISDPALGIHFGRARGPMLQSVRLGIALNLALSVAWTLLLWLHWKHRWAWGVIAILTPLYLLAIYLTYTRSVWMGTGAIVLILLFTMLTGRVRAITLGGVCFATVIAALLLGPSLVAFKREYSEAETLESTKMRGAFAYVSWKMIQDRPILGFGFSQFQVSTPPYLDDRTTNIRLESIRGYVHHNHYLSLLVDLGIVGFILFFLAAISFLQNTLIIYRNHCSSPLARCIMALTLCVVAVHAIQMAFHELSFTTIEQSVLMFAVGLCQAFRDDLVAARRAEHTSAAPQSNPALRTISEWLAPKANSAQSI